jgi:hypothetical protein
MGDKRNYILGTKYGTRGDEFNVLEQFALGAGSGALKIVEAIAELGAGFVDYAADTNLVTYIEENFPKINVDDGVGKFTELLVQYGIPYMGATKIAGKLIGIKKLDQIRKGTGVSGVATKMGYYGGIGAAVEPLVTTSRDQTLGQVFGLTTKPELAELTGRAKAAAVLGQKAAMGVEAAALGAALPVAGVAVKEGFIGATKVAAPVIRGVDYAVINPLADILTKGPIGEKITQPVFDKLTKSVVTAKEITKNKLGLATADELRFVRNPESFIQRVQKSIINNLSTSGVLPKNVFDIKRGKENIFRAKTKDLHDSVRDLYKNMDDVVKNADGLSSKTSSTREVLENDITQILAGERNISSLPKSMQESVKALKKQHDNIKQDIKKLMTNREVLNVSGLRKLDEGFIDDITGSALNDYLKKGIHQSFKVFDVESGFKLRDPKRIAAAEKFVEKFLREQGGAFKDELFIKSTAKKQVDTILNQATHSRSAKDFFETRLGPEGGVIKSKSRPSAKIEFITEDMVKNRDLPKAIEDLLGKGSLKESLFNTNIVLADLLAKKQFINELFLFNKNNNIQGTKFIFTPDYANIARRQNEILLSEGKKPLESTTATIKSELEKLYPDNPSAVRQIIQEDLELQFREQFPNITPPNFRNMGSEFLRIEKEDPFNLYKFMPDHYVPESMYDALIGEVKGWSIGIDKLPFYSSFLGFKGATQAGKTVFSPTTQIRNFTSASFFALHNGHVGRPFGKTEHSFADIIRSHIDEVFPTGKITKEALNDFARQRARSVELGVTQTNVRGREIEDLLKDYLTGDTRFGTVAGFARYLKQTPLFEKSQELYMKGDDIWKDYGWRFSQSQLKGIFSKGQDWQKNIGKHYYDLFNKRFNFVNADGTVKTYNEVIEEVAAQYVKNTYPNYNYVPQFVKDLRRLPFGNFISFPAEILRTSANLMKFASKELASDNAAIRKMGARRMIGQATGFSTGATLATVSLSALDMTRDQYESFRESQVPEWNRYGDLIMLSRKENKDGNVVYRYVPFSYQNPYAYVQAPFYALTGEAAAGKKIGKDFDDRWLNAFGKSIKSVFQPFMDEAILTERIFDITTRGGQPLRGKRLWVDSPDTSLGDKAWGSFAHLMEGIQPGAFTQGTRLTQAIAKEKTAYGKQFELGDEALALFAGIRVYDADLANNLNFQYNDFASVDRANTSLAKSRFFAENATDGTRISAYEEYLDASYETYNRFKKLTDDLKKLGLSPTYINNALTKRSAKKHIRDSIRRGEFVPPNYQSFFDDDRFINLSKKLGVPRTKLFPRKELKQLYSNYRFKDLLQSIESIRSQIKTKNRKREEAREQRRQPTIQGQGTTAGGSPLRTPPAQVTGITQPLGGLASGNLRQRIIRDDEFLKDLA